MHVGEIGRGAMEEMISLSYGCWQTADEEERADALQGRPRRYLILYCIQALESISAVLSPVLRDVRQGLRNEI